MLIAQISDRHVVDPGEPFVDRVDSAAALGAALDTVTRLDPAPDLLLLTGDLVNDGTSTQYDHLVRLLAAAGDVPIVPVMGNHDDRTELRRRFPDRLPPGAADEPVDFTVETHPVRLVVLDTTEPGRHDGRLTPAQLAWLDDVLAAAPNRPTIVVQHHPPFATGIRSFDDSAGFATAADEAEVLARHDHVEAVTAGHVHRSMQRRFGGTVAMTCPSSAAALALELESRRIDYASEPAGILLHHWRPAEGLTSHVVPVGDHDRWAPSWAR